MQLEHASQIDSYKDRIEKLTIERANCLASISDYRQEMSKLTDPKART